jgi:hypothetical protein
LARPQEVAVIEDLGPGTDRDPSGRRCDAHRSVAVSEVGVESAVIVAGANQLAGLIGGDQQRARELAEQLRETLRVDAAQRRIGARRDRSVGLRGLSEERERPFLARSGSAQECGERSVGRACLVTGRLVAKRAYRQGDVLVGLDLDEGAHSLDLAAGVIEKGA